MDGLATRWIPLMRDFVKRVELALRDERYLIQIMFVADVSREW
jgi:hypothetical protein